MNQYFLVDENGFPDYETSKVFGDKVEDGYILGWTTAFYKPRWDGEAWVEGATPKEIEEMLRPAKDIFEERREQTEIVLQMFARTLPNEEAVKVPLVFAEWLPDIDYEVGDVLRYDSDLWRVVQAHTSQADWLPPDVSALYVRIAPPGVIPEWRQPQGAHDAYAKGDEVTHQGKTWQSDVADNIWEPGVYGWEEVTE